MHKKEQFIGNFILPPLAAISLLGIVIGLFASCLKAYHPAFDSFVHIRIYLLWALLFPAFLFFIQPGKRKLLWVVVATFLLGTALQYLDVQKLRIIDVAKNNGRPQYSLMQINLRFDNLEHEKLIQRVDEYKPDFITYEEASSNWQPVIKQLQQTYPYRIECKRLGSPIGHTGILSRHPLSPDQTLNSCPANEVMVQGVYILGEQPVIIRAFHLPWPWPHNQNTILNRLETYFFNLSSMHDKKNISEYQINAGDYNATSPSFAVSRLAKMTETQTLRPASPTWLHYGLPKWTRFVMGLPIDQIQVSAKISVLHFALLPSIGSDHMPLFITFQLR